MSYPNSLSFRDEIVENPFLQLNEKSLGSRDLLCDCVSLNNNSVKL